MFEKFKLEKIIHWTTIHYNLFVLVDILPKNSFLGSSLYFWSKCVFFIRLNQIDCEGIVKSNNFMVKRLTGRIVHHANIYSFIMYINVHLSYCTVNNLVFLLLWFWFWLCKTITEANQRYHMWWNSSFKSYSNSMIIM